MLLIGIIFNAMKAVFPHSKPPHFVNLTLKDNMKPHLQCI